MYFEGRGWKNGEMRREEGEMGGERGKMGGGGGSWGREVFALNGIVDKVGCLKDRNEHFGR